MNNNIEIMNMLEDLEIVNESVISYFRLQDGYNYSNDHSPIDVNEAIKKVMLFIEFGGKVKQFSDHIQVK